MIAPKWQGSLDGLCGVYALINVVRRLYRPNRLTDEQCGELFKFLIKALDRKGQMPEVVWHGTSVWHLTVMLRAVKSFALRRLGLDINWRKPFHRRAHIYLPTYWNRLTGFLGSKGANAKRIAVMGLNGGIWHWTCGYKITRRTIWLIDSDKLTRLNKSDCAIGDSQHDREHSLSPYELYFLEGRMLPRFASSRAGAARKAARRQARKSPKRVSGASRAKRRR